MVGRVAAIQNFGAGDLLDIQLQNGESELIPFTSTHVEEIDIKKKQYDPQIYKYGGAFIYPLGFYYYFLTKINLIEADDKSIPPFFKIVSDPEDEPVFK